MDRAMDLSTLLELLDKPGEPAEVLASLRARVEALDDDPQAHGFEFQPDDDVFGNEGQRAIYYLFRYPQEKCPDGFTARVYILAVEDDGGVYVTGYRAVVCDNDGSYMSDSSNEHDDFDTVAEAIAWLKEELGWTPKGE